MLSLKSKPKNTENGKLMALHHWLDLVGSITDALPDPLMNFAAGASYSIPKFYMTHYPNRHSVCKREYF